jgi:hypothetical protein
MEPFRSTATSALTLPVLSPFFDCHTIIRRLDWTDLFPVRPILFLASVIIPDLPMQQENDKVDDVGVGERCVETCRERPADTA